MKGWIAGGIYCGLALALAAISGGWIGLGRVDPALIIPGLGWATVVAAWVVPPPHWQSALWRSLALVALSIVLVLIFAGAVWPWAQWAVLAVVSVTLNLAAWWTMRATATRAPRRWYVALGGVLVALAVQHGSWRILPSLYAPPMTAHRVSLDVLSGIPLTGDHTQFGASLRGGVSREPVLDRLEQVARVALIDSVPETPVQGRVLLLIHPKALEPQQLVAIDSYVRRGGRAMILADALSNWPQPHPAGDPRNPVMTSLLTPLLTHWGLELDAPPGLQTHLVTMHDAGERLHFFSPGRFRVIQPPCTVIGTGIIARCRLGQGQAVLVSDADWLAAPYWRGPTGDGPARAAAGNMAWLAAEVQALAGISDVPKPLFRPVWVR